MIGQQWQFTYRYPSLGGIESNQLYLPANTAVELHVTSLDAIHSFWAYELGVKADANPGVDNVAYVETKGPTVFHVRCAELCGLWHALHVQQRPRRRLRRNSGPGLARRRSSTPRSSPSWTSRVDKGGAPYATDVPSRARRGEPDDRSRRRPAARAARGASLIGFNLLTGRRARRRRLVRRLVRRPRDQSGRASPTSPTPTTTSCPSTSPTSAA